MKRMFTVAFCVAVLLGIFLLWYVFFHHGTSMEDNVSWRKESNITAMKKDEKIIIERLKKADLLGDEIKIEFNDNKVIGMVERCEVVALTNVYQEFSEVMKLLGNYYTEEAAKKYIQKFGLFEFDGKVGMILADGEEGFFIDDNSTFEFEPSEIVKVTMIGENEGVKSLLYHMKLIDNQWKITDISK